MLKIRLQRVGRKHEPTFRVVVTDSKNSTKSGRFLEVLGSYDPRKTTESFDGEKIKARMAQGAKLSGTLHNLLISKKIIEGKKINVLPRKSPVKSEEAIAAEKAAAEEASKPKVEAKPEVVEVVAETVPEEVIETPIEVAPEVQTEPAPEEPKAEETPTV
jgi:small subunit ribosomal protein S16